MSYRDYTGQTDAESLAWLKNFALKLSESPSTYQVAASECAAIQNAVDLYEAAFNDASDPEQKSPTISAAKAQTLASAKQLCRHFAQQIRLNMGIDNEAKIAAGVRPINPNREPIYCPTVAPAISIVAATFGSHTLRFNDSLGGETRGKPFGATEIQLWVNVGDEIDPDWTKAKFYNKFTRNPLAVAYTPADNGKQATYFARWAGRRGDVSNWSGPATMAIAA